MFKTYKSYKSYMNNNNNNNRYPSGNFFFIITQLEPYKHSHKYSRYVINYFLNISSENYINLTV